MDKLNASIFQYHGETYELEFENILNGITTCYHMMVSDEVAVPNNNEEEIRDILYNGYLKNNTVRNSIGLNYNIVCEPAEYVDGKLSGYVDILIFSRNSLTDTTAYFIIECKRLDNKYVKGISGLNAKYIGNGIIRFVDGQYPSNKGLNGMIGFVVEPMDIAGNILHINDLLAQNFRDARTEVFLTNTTFIRNFDYQYYSIHKDLNSKKIKLYHLMFDFSGNLDSKRANP